MNWAFNEYSLFNNQLKKKPIILCVIMKLVTLAAYIYIYTQIF